MSYLDWYHPIMFAHHLSHVNEHLGMGTEKFKVGPLQGLESFPEPSFEPPWTTIETKIPASWLEIFWPCSKPGVS